jgi:predicted acylesterase/phospholipase RssA
MTSKKEIKEVIEKLEKQFENYRHLVPSLNNLIQTLNNAAENKIENKEKIEIKNTIKQETNQNTIVYAKPIIQENDKKVNQVDKVKSNLGKNSKFSKDLHSIKFRGICLSSGGMKGLLLLGALHEFYIKKQLTDVKYYAGTSVGSIICLLIACGYTPMEIITIACSKEVSNMYSSFNILNLYSLNGIFPFKQIREKIEHLVKLKLGYIPTFKEFLERYDQFFIIPVFCLSEENTEDRKIYCTPYTTPDMSLLDAVIMSSSIPFIFEKNNYKNKIYIDGAFTDNFPIKYLSKIMNKNEPILGLFLEKKILNLNNFFEYFQSIFSLAVVEFIPDKITPKNFYMFELTCDSNVNSVKLDVTVKDKIKLFTTGSNVIKEVFNELEKIHSPDKDEIIDTDFSEETIIQNEINQELNKEISYKEKQD